MRALAEFVMRGRRQALLVAIVASVVPMFFWVGAAVIGLVTLRRGAIEGGLVALWAMLPCMVLAWAGEIIPAAAVAGIWVAAMVLRGTQSWPLTLAAASAMGLLLGMGLLWLGNDYLAMTQKVVEAFFSEVAKQADPAAAAQLKVPGVPQIAGIFAVMHALTMALCMVIARWWQATLYNPGGFREEFHAIRFRSVPGLALLGAGASLHLQAPETQVWAWLFLTPLLVAGTSLLHALMSKRRAGGMLGFYYAALLLVSPAKYMVVGLAAVDALADLRRLLKVASPPSGKD